MGRQNSSVYTNLGNLVPVRLPYSGGWSSSTPLQYTHPPPPPPPPPPHPPSFPPPPPPPPPPTTSPPPPPPPPPQLSSSSFSSTLSNDSPVFSSEHFAYRKYPPINDNTVTSDPVSYTEHPHCNNEEQPLIYTPKTPNALYIPTPRFVCPPLEPNTLFAYPSRQVLNPYVYTPTYVYTRSHNEVYRPYPVPYLHRQQLEYMPHQYRPHIRYHTNCRPRYYGFRTRPYYLIPCVSPVPGHMVSVIRSPIEQRRQVNHAPKKRPPYPMTSSGLVWSPIRPIVSSVDLRYGSQPDHVIGSGPRGPYPVVAVSPTRRSGQGRVSDQGEKVKLQSELIRVRKVIQYWGVWTYNFYNYQGSVFTFFKLYC